MGRFVAAMRLFAKKVRQRKGTFYYLSLFAVFIACCFLLKESLSDLWSAQGLGYPALPAEQAILERRRQRNAQQRARNTTDMERLRPKKPSEDGNRHTRVHKRESLHPRRGKHRSHVPVTAAAERSKFRSATTAKVGAEQDSPLAKSVPSLSVLYGQGVPHDIEACIIPNVCMAFNFTYRRTYIPRAYRRHETLLYNCIPRSPRFTYYDPSDPPPELRHAGSKRLDVDMIGIALTDYDYGHFPHFAVEFVRHAAVAASMFLRPVRPGERWMCPVDQAGPPDPCYMQGAEPENYMKPKFVLSEVMLGKKHSWNRGFFAKFAPRHLHLAPYNPQAPVVCVQSLLVSPLALNTSIRKRDNLFRAGGISRKGGGLPCNPRIVIIVRDAKIKLDRTIPEELTTRLRAELVAKIPEAHVQVLHGLWGLSFKDQVALMQRTDILIAVHGAELSNVLFMRRGASLLQIHPFGQRTMWFNPIIAAAGIRHAEVVARPDKQRFLSCIKNDAPKILPNIAPAMMQKFQERFLWRVGIFERASSDKERKEAGMYYNKEHAMQVCARAQRIVIDPVKIAALVVAEAHEKCKISSGFSSGVFRVQT